MARTTMIYRLPTGYRACPKKRARRTKADAMRDAMTAWLKSLPPRGSMETEPTNCLPGRLAGTRHRAGRRAHQ